MEDNETSKIVNNSLPVQRQARDLMPGDHVEWPGNKWVRVEQVEVVDKRYVRAWYVIRNCYVDIVVAGNRRLRCIPERLFKLGAPDLPDTTLEP